MPSSRRRGLDPAGEFAPEARIVKLCMVGCGDHVCDARASAGRVNAGYIDTFGNPCARRY
jgi:hypothetical protein